MRLSDRAPGLLLGDGVVLPDAVVRSAARRDPLRAP